MFLYILSPISPRARSLCEHHSIFQSKEEAGGIVRLSLGSRSRHRGSHPEQPLKNQGSSKEELETGNLELEETIETILLMENQVQYIC